MHLAVDWGYGVADVDAGGWADDRAGVAHDLHAREQSALTSDS